MFHKHILLICVIFLNRFELIAGKGSSCCSNRYNTNNKLKSFNNYNQLIYHINELDKLSLCFSFLNSQDYIKALVISYFKTDLEKKLRPVYTDSIEDQQFLLNLRGDVISKDININNKETRKELFSLLYILAALYQDILQIQIDDIMINKLKPLLEEAYTDLASKKTLLTLLTNMNIHIVQDYNLEKDELLSLRIYVFNILKNKYL